MALEPRPSNHVRNISTQTARRPVHEIGPYFAPTHEPPAEDFMRLADNRKPVLAYPRAGVRTTGSRLHRSDSREVKLEIKIRKTIINKLKK